MVVDVCLGRRIIVFGLGGVGGVLGVVVWGVGVWWRLLVG